ncbi:DUF6268 family outer membrane beta-barrel protein [Aquimarina mytili]|uniref:DUF6268 domain-containing protein n=1 Tax=Aquimarina mytili TaxID=874423 RepID=A0A936ZZV8_9FLAO|nr:DUF6268 family outer membrane beta-barrel protein [Aquimarina mytili]MBL0684226.1 hypothetical protein [Aquimarina mytili]
MQYHFRHIVLVIGAANVLWSQNPSKEIVGFEYGLIPNLGETSVEKYTVNFNLGKRLNKSQTIGFGVSYNAYNFMFNSTSNGFDASAYENIHDIMLKVYYKYAITTSWSANLMFSPTISSSLSESLSGEDLILSSIATLSKSWRNGDKRSLLVFGIGYGASLGKPQFIPVISFRKKINARWSYILGAPQTMISYHSNERHKISAEASINGFFGNVSSGVDFPEIGSLQNTKLQYNSLDMALQYKYRIQPNWTTIIKMGYSPWNQLKILDNGNNEIYDFGASSSLFISMGLKYNLNK